MHGICRWGVVGALTYAGCATVPPRQTSNSARVVAIAVSPTQPIFATIGDAIVLWDSATGEPRREVGRDARGDFVVFSGDGKLLATCTETTLAIWDVESGNRVRAWSGEFYGVNSIAFSPTDERLATTNIDGVVTIWTLKGGSVAKFKAHDTALSVAFSPDGTALATAGEDKVAAIKIWETKTWRELRPLHSHNNGYSVEDGSGRVWSVKFSPDGNILASVGMDQTARLWNWQTGDEVRRLNVGPNPGRAIDISGDSALVATSNGGDIVLWSTSSGEVIVTLEGGGKAGEGENILAMRFVDGAGLLVSSTSDDSCGDRGTSEWSVTTGNRVSTTFDARRTVRSPRRQR